MADMGKSDDPNLKWIPLNCHQCRYRKCDDGEQNGSVTNTLRCLRHLWECKRWLRKPITVPSAEMWEACLRECGEAWVFSWGPLLHIKAGAERPSCSDGVRLKCVSSERKWTAHNSWCFSKKSSPRHLPRRAFLITGHTCWVTGQLQTVGVNLPEQWVMWQRHIILFLGAHSKSQAQCTGLTGGQMTAWGSYVNPATEVLQMASMNAQLRGGRAYLSICAWTYLHRP